MAVLDWQQENVRKVRRHFESKERANNPLLCWFRTVIVNDMISKSKVIAVFVMTSSSKQVGHDSWFRHYPPQILAAPTRIRLRILDTTACSTYSATAGVVQYDNPPKRKEEEETPTTHALCSTCEEGFKLVARKFSQQHKSW